MNWFERYGIPGAYFVGLMAAWVYALYPDILRHQVCHNSPWLIGLAAIAFLPIGYIISILGQLLYLNCRCLGVHRAAARRAKVFKGLDYEPSLEAKSLLLSALRTEIPVNTHLYMRDWISRRADVMSINGSLIIATVLAPIFAICVLLCLRLSFTCTCTVCILTSVSVGVLILLCCSYCVLRKQVIQVITRVFRTYR